MKFIYAGFIRTVRRKKNIIKKVIAVIDTTFTIAKKSLGKIHVSTGFDNTGGGGVLIEIFRLQALLPLMSTLLPLPSLQT